MPRSIGFTLCCAVLVGGCVAPQPQADILVNTSPPGASCVLSRLGRPIATAGPTPAIALVTRADSPITVDCRRRGFADASVTLPARETGIGYATLVYARAPYAYPQRVDIALAPVPR